jgi:hypothetical protein
MDDCKLCKSAKADKTGSHIVPHFLVKEFVNQAGFSSKDKEITFTLSTKTPDVVKSFFGRGVLPDKIKEVLGSNLNEIEPQLMKDPFVRDYLLCTSCEGKLAVLEGIFQKIIYSKIDRFTSVTEILGIPILQIKESDLMRAFFYSVIWRTSVAHLYSSRLPSSLEDQLRVLVNEILSQKEAELLQNIRNNRSRLNAIPLVIFYSSTGIGSTVVHNISKSPYYFILNDFIICLYSKKKSIYKAPDRGFNIERLPIKQLINHNEEQMTVGILSESRTLTIIDGVINTYLVGMEKRIGKIVDQLFRQIGFARAPSAVTRSIMFDMANYNRLTIEGYSGVLHKSVLHRSVEYLRAFGFTIV